MVLIHIILTCQLSWRTSPTTTCSLKLVSLEGGYADYTYPPFKHGATSDVQAIVPAIDVSFRGGGAATI